MMYITHQENGDEVIVKEHQKDIEEATNACKEYYEKQQLFGIETFTVHSPADKSKGKKASMWLINVHNGFASYPVGIQGITL